MWKFKKEKINHIEFPLFEIPFIKVCLLQSSYFYFLSDNKDFIAKLGEDENIAYYIGNIENGIISSDRIILKKEIEMPKSIYL